jgi:hypothetical protein
MITSRCPTGAVEGGLPTFTQVGREVSRSQSTGECNCCAVPAWLR